MSITINAIYAVFLKKTTKKKISMLKCKKNEKNEHRKARVVREERRKNKKLSKEERIKNDIR